MKIDKFYIALALCRFLAFSSGETAREAFTRLELNEKKCIGGSVIVQSNNYSAQGQYRYMYCHTFAPMCGFGARDVGKVTVISFGCFPAKSFKDKTLGLAEDEFRRPMANFRDMFEYWIEEKPFLVDYFDKHRPNDSVVERLEHESRWVENPSHNVFERKKEKEVELGAFGLKVAVGQRSITPLMLFYILFICFSVLFKLIWLVYTVIRKMRNGYLPVTTKETGEDMEKTIDEIE
ncbi:unnamed protein product [Caenorhabditis sp. 36 PRJEB53466]|nr:unnamed protein product [Caenorhabditis sp. 36 PRJEB53466]